MLIGIPQAFISQTGERLLPSPRRLRRRRSRPPHHQPHRLLSCGLLRHGMRSITNRDPTDHVPDYARRGRVSLLADFSSYSLTGSTSRAKTEYQLFGPRVCAAGGILRWAGVGRRHD